MIVRLRVFGPFEKYFGRARLEVELASGARMRDLWDAIDVRWGQNLPPEFWDSKEKHFRGPVTVRTQNTDVYDGDMPLSDGQEVWLLVVLGGG